MNIEALREEIVSDLDECIERVELRNLLFYPQFEKAIIKTELFADAVNSNTLKQLVILIRGKMSIFSGNESEVRVDENFMTDIRQLKHFVAGVVGK